MQLVIAEKPSVARNIAKVLHATNVKDGYLEGKEYLVSWCIGHLIELASADQYRNDWKAWKYETLPMIPENWKYQIKESTKGQFQILKELLHRADVTEIICATDAGREGELIFRLVYNQAECKLPFKRLWISSMEEKAILEGFQQMKDGHEYDNLYYSAVARSEADWLVGINATRLFTVLYHHRLIVGRVQTPTLAMLVEREKSIENFQKEKYYLVHLLMDGLDAVSNRIKEKSAAVQMMEDMKDETAQILSVKKEKKKVQPPKLYDLTTLQREANRLLGFTAQQTLDYTQSLYEKKLVTYPRTDSQYLTDDMEENALLVVGAVNSMFPEMSIKDSEPDIKRLLNSKKVSDHHAIIPTVEITNMDLKALPGGEKEILMLIASKLLCASEGRERIYYTAKGEKRTSHSNPADCYECSTYNLGCQRYDRHCTCHHISTKALKSIILKTIQETCHYVSLNEQEFVYSLQEESAMKDIAISETVKNRIERNQKRVHELDMLIRKIYEDNVIGRLPDRLFQSMLTDYENEQNELNKIIETDTADMQRIIGGQNNVERFIKLVKKYENITELTPTMINEFIDKILVHEPQGKGADRTTEVEIYLNYVGQFQVPVEQHEPTEEERIAAEKEAERLRRKRESNRKYMKKIREKSKEFAGHERIAEENNSDSNVRVEQNATSKSNRQKVKGEKIA